MCTYIHKPATGIDIVWYNQTCLAVTVELFQFSSRQGRMAYECSQTGNTRKLADAVFEVLPGEKALYLVDEAPDPSDYGFIAVGFWFMGGKPDPKSSEYLGKIGIKPLFLFKSFH